MLHDIGKIGVPDAILQQARALTDEECEQMRKHPEIGARILGGSGLDDIRGWVLAHHERPDGRGYPHGLTRREIPLEASILAVADAYEAMTSDRVYRKAIGERAARAQLGLRGRPVRRRVVAAFLRVLDRTGRRRRARRGPSPGSRGRRGRGRRHRNPRPRPPSWVRVPAGGP